MNLKEARTQDFIVQCILVFGLMYLLATAAIEVYLLY
jgi:hypothetical protein